MLGLVGLELQVDAVERTLVLDEELRAAPRERRVPRRKVAVTGENRARVASDGHARAVSETERAGFGAVGAERSHDDGRSTTRGGRGGRTRRDRLGSRERRQIVAARRTEAVARHIAVAALGARHLSALLGLRTCGGGLLTRGRLRSLTRLRRRRRGHRRSLRGHAVWRGVRAE